MKRAGTALLVTLLMVLLSGASTVKLSPLSILPLDDQTRSESRQQCN